MEGEPHEKEVDESNSHPNESEGAVNPAIMVRPARIEESPAPPAEKSMSPVKEATPPAETPVPSVGELTKTAKEPVPPVQEPISQEEKPAPSVEEKAETVKEPASSKEKEQVPKPETPGRHLVIKVPFRLLIIVGVIVGAMLFVGSVVALARVQHWWNWGLSTKEIQQLQVETTVQRVGALMVLPQGETPTVVNVTDAQSLKSQQAFYQDAQNGDVLLVYSKAQRAILYRPSDNKIVNIGPIYSGAGATTQ